MLATLRNRNFALLWAGGLVSGLGDWLLFIVLPFYIYELTGSTLATGAMFIAQTLPGILLGPVAGVFADRWDRRRTLIVADLLRAAVVLLILLIQRVELVWLVYLAVCAESALGTFFNPAKSALLPKLVPEGQLVAANALSSLSFELTRLIGPALGGILLGVTGIAGLVLLDALSYLVSALLVLLVENREPMAENRELRTENREARSENREARTEDREADGRMGSSGEQPTSPWGRVWGELAAGVRLVVADRSLAALFVMIGIVMVGQGIINVMLVPYINDVLRVGPQEFGWLVMAQGVGGLSGGLLVGHVGRLITPRWLIVLSSLALALIMVLLAAIPVLWVALLLSALAGWPAVGLFVGVPTLIQSGVRDEFRGRVFGAFGTTESLMMLCGLGLASIVGDRAGVVAMLGTVAALYLLAAAVGWLFLGSMQIAPSEQMTTAMGER